MNVLANCKASLGRGRNSQGHDDLDAQLRACRPPMVRATALLELQLASWLVKVLRTNPSRLCTHAW